MKLKATFLCLVAVLGLFGCSTPSQPAQLSPARVESIARSASQLATVLTLNKRPQARTALAQAAAALLPLSESETVTWASITDVLVSANLQAMSDPSWQIILLSGPQLALVTVEVTTGQKWELTQMSAEYARAFAKGARQGILWGLGSVRE